MAPDGEGADDGIVAVAGCRVLAAGMSLQVLVGTAVAWAHRHPSDSGRSVSGQSASGADSDVAGSSRADDSVDTKTVDTEADSLGKTSASRPDT